MSLRPGGRASATVLDRAALVARYLEVRRTTERLCAPLAVEDYVVQAMPDVSPTKWHLAHVSWFFETFLVAPHLPGYEPPNDGSSSTRTTTPSGRSSRDPRADISRAPRWRRSTTTARASTRR